MSNPTLAQQPAPPKRNDKDVIESAYVTATMRALLGRIGRVRNPDYLAHHFASNKWKLLLKLPDVLHWYVERRVPGCCYYHLIRTLHFDTLLREALAEGGFSQLVLLGAGYDTRPHRFSAQLSATTTFEVDLPGTQAVKREQVRRVIGEPTNRIVYVAANFQEDDLLGLLQAHNYATNSKTLFLWEGVTYFLTKDAVERALNFMSQHSAQGSVVVFDYALRDYVEGDLSFYGAQEIARELHRIGEPHIFGLNAEDIGPFLNQFNCRIESDLGSAALEQKYLSDAHGSPYAKAHAFNRIVCARIAK